MKKLWKRIKAILMALMYVAIYFAVTVAIETIYVVWKNFSTGATLSEVAVGTVNNLYALSVIAVIITFWIYLIIGHIRKAPLYKVVNGRKATVMMEFMAICLAVGLRLMVTAYFHYSQNIELLKNSIDEASAITPELTSPLQLMTALLCVILIAPIFEELLFRGIVMYELGKVMRPWSAIALQGIMFGIAHGVLFQSIFSMVIGIILGVVYYRTKSIKTVVICHSVFNLSVVVTMSELDFVSGIIVAVTGFALAAFSFVYLILENRQK